MKAWWVCGCALAAAAASAGSPASAADEVAPPAAATGQQLFAAFKRLCAAGKADPAVAMTAAVADSWSKLNTAGMTPPPTPGFDLDDLRCA